MGIPNVTYRWSTLKLLYISIFTMNITGIITVIIMIVSAINLKTGFGNYLNLVTPGDGYLWPSLMIVAAILCAPLYVLGIRFCIRLKFKRNFSAEESLRLNKDLFIHMIFCVASIFLAIFINAASIVHSSTFYSRIQNGLREAMENYASDVIAKVRIDSVQIEFRCCGSNSYKDWFFIPWMRLGSVQSTEKIDRIEDADEEGNENEFLADDVPFSCCLKNILGPCVHHNIMAGSDVYLYESNDKLSIATAGCHSKMLNTATLVGNLIVLVLFFLSVYQLVLSILLRLLQTAHSNTFYIGPRKSHYVAWIFGSMPLQENSDKLINEEEAFLEEDVDRPSKDCASFQQPLPQEILSSLTLNGYKNRRTQLLRRICSKLSLKLAAANRDGHRLLSSLGISGEKQEEIQEEEVQKAEGMTSDGEEWVSPLKKVTTAAPLPPSPDFSPEITSEGKILEACCTSEDSDRNSMNKLRGRVFFQPTKRSKSSDISESSKTRIGESDKGRHSQSGSKINTPPRFVSCKVQLFDTEETEHENSILHYPGKSPTVGQSWLRSPGSQINSDSEHESQLSRHHRKLNTDYNRSVFMKRRGAFNKKENECQQPCQDSRSRRQRILRDIIKDPGCQISSKFNPSDAYNRFRGSNQDTIRRRENQMQAKLTNLTSDLNRPSQQRRWACNVNDCQHMSKLRPMIHHPVSQVEHSLVTASQICSSSFSPPPPPPPPPPLPPPSLATSIPVVKRMPWSSKYRKSSGSPAHWMTISSLHHASSSARPAFPQLP